MKSVTNEIEMIDKSAFSLRNVQLLDLNDDCIMAVLEHLPLEDLNRMSLVCKRIYQLSDSVYRREYLEHLQIEVRKGLIPDFVGDYFPRRFSSEVPNLRVFYRATNDLFVFIRANCCRNLKRIYFSGGFERVNGEIIKDQLSTIEYLSVCSHSSEEFDVYDILLQFCRNLKHLKVQTGDRMWNMNFLTKTYPKLIRLDIPDLEQATDGELLKQFIENNWQLQTVTCSRQLIHSMLPNLPKFKRLIISDIDGWMSDELESFCDNRTIEWLEIDSRRWRNKYDQDLDGVAKLRSLRAIGNLWLRDEDHEQLSALQRMTQLRELYLECADEKVIEIASKLPELVKVTLNFELMNATQILTQFAKNSKKLKTIEMRCYSNFNGNRMTFKELVEIDSVRSMVPVAQKMSLIFNMSGNYERNPYKGENLGDLKFIRVKIVHQTAFRLV